MADKIDYNIDDLYNAIAFAEGTGFTRTTGIPEKGSTAYGPAGLTGGSGSMIAYQLANLGRTGIEWSDKELEFMRRYREHAGKMAKYGNKDWINYIDPDTGLIDGMTQDEVVKKYEYGGTGDLSGSDKELYELVAKKLIKSEYERAGGDIDKFIQSWRGPTGHFKGGKDTSYVKKVKKELNILDQKRRDDLDKSSFNYEQKLVEDTMYG